MEEEITQSSNDSATNIPPTPSDISYPVPSGDESEFEILEHKPLDIKTEQDVKETALMGPLKNKSSSSNNLLDSEDYAHALQETSGSDDNSSLGKPVCRQAFLQFSISEKEEDGANPSSFGLGKLVYKYLSFLKQGKR